MIKRIFIVFTVACLLASPLAVHADLVMGNDFHHKNENKIMKLDRNRFVVNGPDGYVVIKDEPGSTRDMIKYMQEQWAGVKDDTDYIKRAITLNNGEEIIIDGLFTYNGKYWGIMSTGHAVSYPGWIPMEHLRVPYLCEDFNNEHKEEFYAYTGDYDKAIKANKLVIWQWPGSDREKLIIDKKDFTIHENSALYAYKEEEGREWGYVKVEYKYPSRDGSRRIYYTVDDYEWICLSDPENSEIPSFNPAQEPTIWSPEATLNKPLLIIVLLFVLIGGTIILIIIFLKRNKTGRESND